MFGILVSMMFTLLAARISCKNGFEKLTPQEQLLKALQSVEPQDVGNRCDNGYGNDCCELALKEPLQARFKHWLLSDSFISKYRIEYQVYTALPTTYDMTMRSADIQCRILYGLVESQSYDMITYGNILRMKCNHPYKRDIQPFQIVRDGVVYPGQTVNCIHTQTAGAASSSRSRAYASETDTILVDYRPVNSGSKVCMNI